MLECLQRSPALSLEVIASTLKIRLSTILRDLIELSQQRCLDLSKNKNIDLDMITN